MDRVELKLAGIDYNEGIGRFAGNEALYVEYLIEFCEDDMFAKLKEAVLRKDYQEAFSCAHALKGGCGNLSMNKLYHSIAKLTEELRADPEDSRVAALFEAAERCYIKAVEAVQNNKR